MHVKHASGQAAAPGKLCRDCAQWDGYRYSPLRAGDFQARNRDKLFTGGKASTTEQMGSFSADFCCDKPLPSRCSCALEGERCQCSAHLPRSGARLTTRGFCWSRVCRKAGVWSRVRSGSLEMSSSDSSQDEEKPVEEAEDDDSFRTGRLPGGTAPASSSGPPRSVTMTAGMLPPMAGHWPSSPVGATTTSPCRGAGPDGSGGGLLPSTSPTAGTTITTDLPSGSAVLGQTCTPATSGASLSP